MLGDLCDELLPEPVLVDVAVLDRAGDAFGYAIAIRSPSWEPWSPR